MNHGKLIIRYRDTGEVLAIPKQPRPKLCHTCRAYATWAMQEAVQATLIDLDTLVKRQIHLRHTYFCEYHVKKA